MRISAIAILVALFLWPAAVFGQSPELMDAYNRVGELYAEGRYQEAIPFAKEALHLSEREFNPDHPVVAVSLNIFALIQPSKSCRKDRVDRLDRQPYPDLHRNLIPPTSNEHIVGQRNLQWRIRRCQTG